MSNVAKVTIVVPNYNYGKHLPACLTGLIRQTLPPTTIIVVDDKSTDNSVEECISFLGKNEYSPVESYKQKFPKYNDEEVNIRPFISKKHPTQIFIVEKPTNDGPSKTRNVGIMLTENCTDIYGLCDSDDTYLSNKLEKSINSMTDWQNQPSIVYSDYISIDSRGGNVASYPSKREYKEPFYLDRLVEECIVSNNSFITKSVFQLVGLYDEQMRVAEDYDLWLRAAMTGKVSLYHVPEPLYNYAITGEGATFSVSKERWNKDWARIRAKFARKAG